MNKRRIVFLLRKLPFPIKPVIAASIWGTSVEHARHRLNNSACQGFLIKAAGLFSPSEALLNIWDELQ